MTADGHYNKENFDKTLNERDVLTQIKVNSAKYIRENLNLL